MRTLDGHTLEGDAMQRAVNFCGPAAFVALKAFAFTKRAEQKDAYDLVYVLRRWPKGIDDIAARMAEHADREPSLTGEMLGLLDRDFRTLDSAGPRSASRFYDGIVDDDRVADSHGAARDFLASCERRRVTW